MRFDFRRGQVVDVLSNRVVPDQRAAARFDALQFAGRHQGVDATWALRDDGGSLLDWHQERLAAGEIIGEIIAITFAFLCHRRDSLKGLREIVTNDVGIIWRRLGDMPSVVGRHFAAFRPLVMFKAISLLDCPRRDMANLYLN
jgi:hypothetical protein